MIKGLEHLSDESWACSAWRRLTGDLINAYKYFEGENPSTGWVHAVFCEA